MGVRQARKHEVAAAMRDRYWAASRAGKSRLLDEFCAVTGYHRNYAKSILRHGIPTGRARIAPRRGRPFVYRREVMAALRTAADATGWICGKRLAPFLGELLPALEIGQNVLIDHTTSRLVIEVGEQALSLRSSAPRLATRGRRRGSRPS